MLCERNENQPFSISSLFDKETVILVKYPEHSFFNKYFQINAMYPTIKRYNVTEFSTFHISRFTLLRIILKNASMIIDQKIEHIKNLIEDINR